MKFLNPKNIIKAYRNYRDFKRDFYALKRFVYRDKLESLNGKFKGQRCFILGNGPSLSLYDIEKLKNEVTFASNKIYLLFEETSWRPTFYSVEDHLVLQQNIEKISAVGGTLKLFPEHPPDFAPLLDDTIYFPFHFEDFFPGQPMFGTSLTEKIYWGSSIVYTQMQMAVAMGFKNIYLLGVDYTYKVPNKSDSDGSLVSEGEVNHFHKEYRRPGEKWNVPNLHYHEKSFSKAKEESEKYGAQILNATRGGKLEIFERVSFDNLF